MALCLCISCPALPCRGVCFCYFGAVRFYIAGHTFVAKLNCAIFFYLYVRRTHAHYHRHCTRAHVVKATFDDQCYQELPDFWDKFFDAQIESPGTDVKLYYGHG